KARSGAAVEALADADATLLDALKQLRLVLARERRVPAYAIFPDRTLIDMAARKPRTTNEFAEVHGVGAAKLNDFADTFLATIRNHRALPG
ncbi:MAG: HRDC domain-containing protein, partial [Alphaproteobacteria bacterium]